MTVVYTYAATENARSRRKARRAGLQPVATATKRCDRVAKALTLIDGPAAPRQAQKDCGAMCLPQVAMFNAGHRKTRKDAVHIIK